MENQINEETRHQSGIAGGGAQFGDQTDGDFEVEEVQDKLPRSRRKLQPEETKLMHLFCNGRFPFSELSAKQQRINLKIIKDGVSAYVGDLFEFIRFSLEGNYDLAFKLSSHLEEIRRRAYRNDRFHLITLSATENGPNTQQLPNQRAPSNSSRTDVSFVLENPDGSTSIKKLSKPQNILANRPASRTNEQISTVVTRNSTPLPSSILDPISSPSLANSPFASTAAVLKAVPSMRPENSQQGLFHPPSEHSILSGGESLQPLFQTSDSLADGCVSLPAPTPTSSINPHMIADEVAAAEEQPELPNAGSDKIICTRCGKAGHTRRKRSCELYDTQYETMMTRKHRKKAPVES